MFLPRKRYCIVLDPFFGSGVTGKISKKLNRNFIGFEIDEKRVIDYSNKFEQNNLFDNKLYNQ